MADPSRGEEMVLMREYSKGNWTVTETLVLIEAKKMDEERRVRRSIGLPPEKQPEIRTRPPELRWKWIEEYCWSKGCLRNQNQCNDKWDNLMRDYKKIREYERWRVESSFETGSSSYWKMEKSERKERNLPSNMLPQIYEALAELVEKKSLPSSSSSSAVGNGNGGSSGGQILRVCQQSLGFVAPMMAQPMRQVPAATIVLPLPPQPPPPQRLVLSHPPPQQPPSSTFHAEAEPIQPTVDTSAAKRRRTTPGETTAGEEREAEEIAIGAELSRSATVIAQVIRENEERQERRHKDVVRLQERRIKIEELKAEINRQGMSGLVDAINKLATSILSLASSSCHYHQNHQGGPQ